MDVKAKTKLAFRNTAGNPLLVVRTFQLTQQASKLSFKTLDSTLVSIDDGGKVPRRPLRDCDGALEMGEGG